MRANAKATIDFATAKLKKAEQIAQQNTFSLFTVEDKNITCDLARQWLHLRRTQELAKLKAEVAASNVPAPPRVGVCSSPSNVTPSYVQTPSSSPASAPPPAPTHGQGLVFRNALAITQTHHQGLGFRDFNEDDDVDVDDCAELDCEEDSSDLFGDKRRVVDLNSAGSDFDQSASDRKEDTTINLNSKSTDFQVIPPPSQRRRLSIDLHDIHAAHVQFSTS